MTRILRLLLIAAVAWPMWQSAAAQEMERATNSSPVPDAKVLMENIEMGNSRDVMRPAKLADLPYSLEDADKVKKEHATGDVTTKKAVSSKVKKGAKTVIRSKAAPSTKADIPDGQCEIIFHVENVWNDGSGYQLLIGNTSLGAATSIDAALYSSATYKIPTNADYSSTANPTNMIVEGTQSITIPAGTYGYFITNPTPSEETNYRTAQGTYTFVAGISYEFHIYPVSGIEMVEIIDPLAVLPPTDLTDLPGATSAEITWTAGQNNEAWNLRYREYVDPADHNRFWDFEDASQLSDFSIIDYDADGFNWGRVNTDYVHGSYCLMSASFNGNDNTALTPNNWLITPKIQLGGTLTFYARGVTNSWYREKFGVYICQGDTWTSVHDFTQILNDQTTSNSARQYTVNLSSYSGYGYIAIVHHNVTDQYALLVDDISVTVPNPQPEAEWIYVNGVTSPYTITGLTTGTTYEVQVQGEGSGETTNWTGSNIFTTFVAEPRDIAVKDNDFFEGKEYTWTDGDGNHTSNLSEIATKPEQMIAMIQKIYTDKTIPGNLKRGFDVTGGNNTPNQDVYYTGVGGLKLNSGASDYLSASSYSYDDIYGWGISGNVATPNTARIDLTGADAGYYTTAYYTHMQLDQYKPNEEGLTLLLVELKDTYVDGSNTTIASGTYDTEYDRLKAYFENTVKSVRVITEAKRSGEGLRAGTLFKIDCDKMNKFFLLAKGQLNLDHNTMQYLSHYSNVDQGETDFCPAPVQMHFNNSDFFRDENTSPLFYHMFEQFSPVANDATSGLEDIYQSLVNMDSFGVLHDCIGITNMNHEFMMYGPDSKDADCQDVRDMMFFVPDYRMLYWNRRGVTEQEYHNYYRALQPSIGLFVIRQNDITGEQVNHNNSDEFYKLHLTWDSNLLDFLPGTQGRYTLYRVITDENGNKSYEAVGQFYPDTFMYDDYLPMQQNGYEVTYVVQGQDVDGFLSLQMSNEKSYLIPGLDPSEMVMLNNATYYSRYNPQTEKNCYSNKLMLSNFAMGLNNNNITSSTKLTLNRIYTEKVDGASTIITKPVANITFNTGSKTMTVTMDNQSPSSEYPNGKTSGTAAGYHANPGETTWNIDYTVVESGSNAGNLIYSLPIFDNFTVKVSNNEHPASYAYSVESNYDASASSTSIYVNATACTTGDEVWYAWTWNNENDGKWVKGVAQGNLLKFVAVKNNMLIVRMNAHPAEGVVLPSWAAEWNRTPETVSTVGNIGKTYTIGWYNDNSGKIWGQWSNDVMPENAHSNSIRIPVYKTGSQMTSFSENDVLGDTDGSLELPESVDFAVDVQLNSKTELLRYDAYRWKNTAATSRYIINTVDGDDEGDIAPNGIAGNQGTSYSVSMNVVGTPEYTSSTASLGANGWGIAHFEDVVPINSNEAAIFDYAPVVETFASGFDENRTDYNTYGGPMQRTASCELNVDHPTFEISTYSWLVGSDRYAYYTVTLPIIADEVPAGYKIYKVRAWRQLDPTLLDEPIYTERKTESGKYCFEDINGGDYQQHMVLGATDIDDILDNSGNEVPVCRGTFGARKVTTTTQGVPNDGCLESLPMTFQVRLYFTLDTQTPSNAPGIRPRAEGSDSQPYYIVEYTTPFTINGDIPTGIVDVMNAKQVVSEKYYNPAGIESDTPFKGVNIVVTRYSDGSTSTVKVLK